MTYTARSIIWIIVYLLFILLPLFALLLGSLPPARDFWTEFSAAVGYSALAIMGLQFGLTARFRFVTEPWGEDVIYHFHRQISLFAVALALVHPAIMLVVQPHLLALPQYGEVPLGAVSAFLSVIALVVLVVTALWRARLKISYELWHYSHIALALVAVAGALVHMVGWSFYLTDSLKWALWVGLTIFWIALLFYIRIVKPLFLLRRPYRVTEIRKERGETVTLVMQPDGHDGFRFKPGQFGWLTVWGNPFKITAHPFSFSSSAQTADGTVAMSIRNLGDFTSGISNVPVGKRIYLDGPYGAFTIGDPADMHVLIAGGVGITPMMSMIRTLADVGDKRPVMLLYGSKDWDSITFREELEDLKVRLDLTIVHVLSDPSADWAGERGFISADLLARHLTRPYADHEYFICGPGPMMDAVEKALADLGVPMSKYHSERYSFV
ncbi:ferredoxin reductase family protein [Bradyrhizobium sp. ARR65]|uniref:ferredoxin reductase family protein n=1 Tax=Bradyrhizobium sp. ARR65 TaxID=1040989 RepID=UPI000466E164|nr:ferredoxin reductase family protein [Bradyrhizobium sp. ARR65]